MAFIDIEQTGKTRKEWGLGGKKHELCLWQIKFEIPSDILIIMARREAGHTCLKPMDEVRTRKICLRVIRVVYFF